MATMCFGGNWDFIFPKLCCYICILHSNTVLTSIQSLSVHLLQVIFGLNVFLVKTDFLGPDTQTSTFFQKSCYIFILLKIAVLTSPQPLSGHPFQESYGKKCAFGENTFLGPGPQIFTFSKICCYICILLSNTLLMSPQPLSGHHFQARHNLMSTNSVLLPTVKLHQISVTD